MAAPIDPQHQAKAIRDGLKKNHAVVLHGRKFEAVEVDELDSLGLDYITDLHEVAEKVTEFAEHNLSEGDAAKVKRALEDQLERDTSAFKSLRRELKKLSAEKKEIESRAEKGHSFADWVRMISKKEELCDKLTSSLKQLEKAPAEKKATKAPKQASHFPELEELKTFGTAGAAKDAMMAQLQRRQAAQGADTEVLMASKALTDDEMTESIQGLGIPKGTLEALAEHSPTLRRAL